MLAALYLWIKALHIIAIIAWMAGMLYMPRLFVYHVETCHEHINPKYTLERWQYLLIKRIINPAMMVAILCGILLMIIPGVIDYAQAWFWIKLCCVIMLLGFYGFLNQQRKLLKAGHRPYSGKTYRILNEIPSVLIVIIVIMVIIRPF